MMKRLAILSLALLAFSPAWAQSTPGVGFNKFPGKPDPWAGGTFSQEAFIQRYGYASNEWIKMPGMIAEFFFVNEIALRNACHAGVLGDPNVFDCNPKLIEQQDLAATVPRPTKNGGVQDGDNFYCKWWFAPTFEGGTPDRAIQVSRKDRPLGPFSEASNPFWRCPVYYVNVPSTAPTCVEDGDTACLVGDRFSVEVTWRTGDGQTGAGRIIPVSDNSTLVWFFSPSNIEMLVKVLDACVPGFDSYWVFYAATTNVEFTVTVTDTITGDTKTYRNEQGHAASPVQDTAAFATCHP
jgi:hypothetical protein